MASGSRKAKGGEGHDLNILGDAKQGFDPRVVEGADPTGSEPFGVGGQGEVIHSNRDIYEHAVVAHVSTSVVVDVLSAGHDQDRGFGHKALTLA